MLSSAFSFTSTEALELPNGWSEPVRCCTHLTSPISSLNPATSFLTKPHSPSSSRHLLRCHTIRLKARLNLSGRPRTSTSCCASVRWRLQLSRAAPSSFIFSASPSSSHFYRSTDFIYFSKDQTATGISPVCILYPKLADKAQPCHRRHGPSCRIEHGPRSCFDIRLRVTGSHKTTNTAHSLASCSGPK